MKVLVWNEYRHERENPVVANIYPQGIHTVIAEFLRGAGYDVSTATLDEPDHGLTEAVLAETDVLIWWGHRAHDEVQNGIVAKVQNRVLEGMGLLVLHSGHFSKLFKNLMGTTCDLKWREVGEKERLWVVDPSHPITEGIGSYIELTNEEMYGEHFDIPVPDELVFVSWFEGGEVFRSGCTFRRGSGKIFYFRPGHESYPTYYHDDIQKVIINAVNWLKPIIRVRPVYGNVPSIESISNRKDE